MIPARYDLPACTRCVDCGKQIVLTWTSSCVGWGILCGNCGKARGY